MKRETSELKKERKEKQLTQVEVAKKAGVSERVYQRYEANQSKPLADTAILIADALRITSLKRFKEIFGTRQLQLRGNTKEPESKSG